MSISDRLSQVRARIIRAREGRQTDLYMVLDVDAPDMVNALRAVLAIDTGDNRNVYGIDFEAGMCKALATVHQTIAITLGEGS